jgi:predicted anti-sigma-YlaC factor YlaD
MAVRRRFACAILVICALALSSCSTSRFVARVAGRALGGARGGGPGASAGAMSAFTSDDDPELVSQALPTMIKLGESLLASEPGNPVLGRSVGSLYVMYSNAFVEGPALFMPASRYDEKVAAKARALKLYKRGAAYLRRAVEALHPGLLGRLETPGAAPASSALASLKKADVPYLYWYAAAQAAAFALDPLDPSAAMSVPVVLAFVARATELDPGFSNGSLYDLSISLYGSLPEALGGSRQRAGEAFAKALEASKGRTASPYLAYAVSLAIPAQDLPAFRSMLEKALAVEVDAYPANRLANTLNQRKARWYLDHAADYFDIETE